jgi:hypothetical protein
MGLKLTLDLSGVVVIDPTNADDMKLLTLLSTKQLLVRCSTYTLTGYVGQHLEPGTMAISQITEDLAVQPRGTHDAQWQAYDEERTRRKAQEVAVSNAA